jgi:hypothetical protein
MKILIVFDLASISESAGSLWGPFHRELGKEDDQIKYENYNHVKDAVSKILCYLRGENMDIPMEIAFQVIDSRPEYLAMIRDSEQVLKFREFSSELPQQLSEIVKNTKNQLKQRKRETRNRVRRKKVKSTKRNRKTCPEKKVRVLSTVNQSMTSYGSLKKNSKAVDILCWVIRRALRLIAFDEEDTRSHIIMFSTLPPEEVIKTSPSEVLSKSEMDVTGDNTVNGKTAGYEELPVLEALVKVCKETSEKTVSLHWINIQRSDTEYDPNYIKTINARMKLVDSRSLGVLPIQCLLSGSQLLPLGAFLGTTLENPKYRIWAFRDLLRRTSKSDPIWFGDIVMAPPDEQKVLCSVLLTPHISSSSYVQIFKVPSNGQLRIHAYVSKKKYAPVFRSFFSFLCEPRGMRSFRFSQLMQILGKIEKSLVLDITDTKGNFHTALLTPISSSIALVQIIFKDSHKSLLGTNPVNTGVEGSINLENLICEDKFTDCQLTNTNTLHLQPPHSQRFVKTNDEEEGNSFCPQSLDEWTGVWCDPVLDSLYEEIICSNGLVLQDEGNFNPVVEIADDSVSEDEDCEFSNPPFTSDNSRTNFIEMQYERPLQRQQCLRRLVQSEAVERTIRENNCLEQKKKDLRLVGLVKAYNDQLRYLSGDPYQTMIVDSVRPVLKNCEVNRKELAKWLKDNLLKRLTDVVGNKSWERNSNVQLTKTDHKERFLKEKKLECQLQVLLRMEIASLITKNGKVVDPAKKFIRKEIKHFMGLLVVHSSNRHLRFFIDDLKRWYSCLSKTIKDFSDLVEDEQESPSQPINSIDTPLIETRRPADDTPIHSVNELTTFAAVEETDGPEVKEQVVNNGFKQPRNISMIKRELNKSRQQRRNKIAQFNTSILQQSVIHSESSFNVSNIDELPRNKHLSFTNPLMHSILGKRPLPNMSELSHFKSLSPGRRGLVSSPLTTRTILGNSESTIMATPDVKRRRRVQIPVNESPSVFLNVLIPPTPIMTPRQGNMYTPQTSPTVTRGLNFQSANESGITNRPVSSFPDLSGGSNDLKKEIPPSPEFNMLEDSRKLSLSSRLKSPKRIVLTSLENMSDRFTVGPMPRKLESKSSIAEEITLKSMAEISIDSIANSDSEVSLILQ